MELLSPAGNYKSAKAAFAAGADAVYIGGGFSARAFAENFSDEDFLRIIEYAHLHGKRVYAAVNTMLFENELKGALEHVGFLYDAGIDAVIMADMGLADICRSAFPNLPIHISTQAGLHDIWGAGLAKDIGAERIVPARETTLAEMNKIADEGIEVEAFCHGALCSCYSGACLMSSLIGARSGNRGKCAQPCRLPYDMKGETSYALSPADLCTIDHTDDFLKAGIASLKIEGRMKSPEYVFSVTEQYRKALDGEKDKDAKKKLKQIFNRGGFTEGYLFGNRDVVYKEKPDHIGVYIGKVLKLTGKNKAIISSSETLEKLDALRFTGESSEKSIVIGFADKMEKGYVVPVPIGVKTGDKVYRTASSKQMDEAKIGAEKELTLLASAELLLSENAEGYLKMTSGDAVFEVRIPPCEQALNDPNVERLACAVKKTGGTGVTINNVKVNFEGRPFLSASALNCARRDCVEGLKKELALKARRYLSAKGQIKTDREKILPEKTEITASVLTPAQAKAAFEGGAKRVYVYPDTETDLAEYEIFKGRGIYIAFPPFAQKRDFEKIKQAGAYFDGALCCGWGEMRMAKEIFGDVRADFWLNIANSDTQELLIKEGVSSHTASVEANLKQLEALKYPFETVVYGHIPTMIMRHCPLKEQGYCGECKTASLKDRRGYELRFLRMGAGECRSVLLNGVLTAIDEIGELKKAGAQALRLMFFYEDEQKVFNITKMYANSLCGEKITVEEEHNSAHLHRGV